MILSHPNQDVNMLPAPKSQLYLQRYYKLILHAQTWPQDGYVERHHIHPRAMGGTDDKVNIVKLSARQHYVAHKLLWKAYETRETARAFFFMSHRTVSKTKLSSKAYVKLKESMSVSAETKQKLSAAFVGKSRAPFAESTKLKMSAARIGIIYSSETRAKMSASAKQRPKFEHSSESKAKMKAAAKEREEKKKALGYQVSDETKQKLSNAGKGKQLSPETRAKLSEAAKRQHQAYGVRSTTSKLITDSWAKASGIMIMF